MYKNFLFILVNFLALIGLNFTANLFLHNYLEIGKNFYIETFATLIILTLISFFPKKLKIFTATLFFIFELIDLTSFIYFHNHIQYYQIGIIFNLNDLEDMIIALKPIISQIAVGFSILIGFIFLISKIDTKTNKKSIFAFIFILLFLSFQIFKKPYLYISSSSHLSYLNTLFSINLYIKSLFTKSHKKFKPYIVQKVDNGKHLVVFILGESLNYKRMHLFGFNIKDTPYLEKFAKENPNFIYKKAISSGVNTSMAMAHLFNLKREPQNVDVILNQKTDLLKLAKENNYKVYWISKQEVSTNILKSMFNYADVIKQDSYFIKHHKKYDTALLEELKKIDLSKKSFIVLHLRANHSPYEEYTPKEFYKYNFHTSNFHKKMLNSYIDSVLFVDKLLYDIFSYLKNKKDISVYFVSDHGEMLGFKEENGKYGHSQLDINCAYIPFLYYSDTKKELNKTLYNHYLIGKMVARDLGYKVINPNDNNNTYYINGMKKIDGSNGYIEYNLTPFKVIKKVMF